MPDLTARLQAALGTAYKLESELSGGGMSRVFRFRDTRLDRAVVVKVLPPDLGASVNIARFQREIAVAAKLQHPHIVPMLTAGSHDDLLYYIMPYIDGQSLRTRLADDPRLPIGDTLRILREVADALAHAHGHGIVHRDIKPGNVLLSGKHAFVTDFGVAKAVEESTGKATLVTMGVALGTPAYMAPEQAMGDVHTDHRADVYAFGVLGYEMLTGRTPFTGVTPQALVTAHVTQQPEQVGKFRPDLPLTLGRVIMRCLAKQPADRWQSAAEVLDQLEQMATPTGGVAPATTTPERWSAKRRIAAAVIGVVALATAVFFGLRLFNGGSAGTLLASGVLEERDRLVLADFDNRTSDSTLGPSVSEAFRIDLAQSRAVRLLDAPTIAAALERMRQPRGSRLSVALARDLAQREGAKGVVRGQIDPIGSGYVLAAELVSAADGSILIALRENARNDGELIDAVDRLSKQLRQRIGESLRTIRASEPLERVTTGSLDALRSYSQAVHAELNGEFDRAITLLEQAIERDTGFAMAHRKLAMALFNTSNALSRIDAAATNAFHHRDRLPPLERHLTTGTYYSRVELDRGKAEEAYRAALALEPDNFIAGNNLTELYVQSRRFAAAESLGLPYLSTGWFPIYINVIHAQLGQGKLDDAAAVMRAYELTTGAVPTSSLLHAFLDENRDAFDSAEARVRSVDRQLPDLAWQAWQASHLFALAQLRGRLRDAAAQARRSMEVSERRGLPGSYVAGAVQLGMMQLRFEQSARAARGTVETALLRHPLATMPVEDRPYALLVMFLAEAGDLEQARRLLAEYEHTVPERLRRRDGFLLAALGAMALAEGRREDGIRSYRAWHDRAECARCGLYEIATIYDQAGQVDSARIVAELALTNLGLYRIFEDTWGLARTYKRLGELYEIRGDSARALAYYNKFVDLWKNADPVLQPAVRDVRSRVARFAADARR
ncbi:MAG TPA: protein kinase [Gemmatimonadales bacterium]|nr:protein kinase [Gemmatimonadales bacterium]